MKLAAASQNLKGRSPEVYQKSVARLVMSKVVCSNIMSRHVASRLARMLAKPAFVVSKLSAKTLRMELL